MMTQRRLISWVLIAGLVVFGGYQAYTLQQAYDETAAVRAQADFWQDIIERTSEAIVVLDDEGIVRHFNPAAERLFGVSRDTAVGKDASWMMPADKWREHRNALRRAFAERQDDKTSIVLCYAIGLDDAPIYVEIRTRIVQNGAKWFAVAQIQPAQDVEIQMLDPPDDPPPKDVIPPLSTRLDHSIENTAK